MNSRITESDSCCSCCEKHPGLGFSVLLSTKLLGTYFSIFDCPRKKLDTFFESMHTPDITDWICALICRTKNGVGGTWITLIVWNCGPGFKGMTEDVKT
jgi:hypothetical protein